MLSMQREGYYDYMGRKLREDSVESIEVIMRKEITEMQKSVHILQMRVKNLSEQVVDLEYKIILTGGNPDQIEMRF